MYPNFFQHRSPTPLAQDADAQVQPIYDILKKDEALTRTEENRLGTQLSTADICQHLPTLETLVSQHDERLADLRVLFRFYQNGNTLSDRRRNAYQAECEHMLQTFLLDYKVAVVKGQAAATARAKQIADCFALRLLLDPDVHEQITPDTVHQALQAEHSDGNRQYIGLRTILPTLEESLAAIRSANTEKTVEALTNTNEIRLFWMWAGETGMFGSFLMAISENYANARQAHRFVFFPALLSTFLSISVYYVRFLIKMSLVSRHTAAFLMSENADGLKEEEAMGTAWQRFEYEAGIRKLDMINDACWATVNLLCVIWLIGDLMYYNDLLNGIFFGVDLIVALWDWWDHYAQHVHDDTLLDNDIQTLEAIGQNRRSDEQTIELETLKNTKAKSDIDWTYEQRSLIYETAYAALLCISFAITCSFYIPSAAVLFGSMTITYYIIGATGCVVLTLINEALQGLNNVHHTQALNAFRQGQIETLTQQEQAAEAGDEELPWLALEKDRLQLTNAAALEEANNDMMKTWYSVGVKALGPSAVFTAALYLSLTPALSVLAAVTLLSAATYAYLPQPTEKQDSLEEFEAPATLSL